MKPIKTKRTKSQFVKIDCIEQFTELYLPTMSSSKKNIKKDNDENYGNLIAMTILDGIKRDLTATK